MYLSIYYFCFIPIQQPFPYFIKFTSKYIFCFTCIYGSQSCGGQRLELWDSVLSFYYLGPGTKLRYSGLVVGPCLAITLAHTCFVSNGWNSLYFMLTSMFWLVNSFISTRILLFFYLLLFCMGEQLTHMDVSAACGQ